MNNIIPCLSHHHFLSLPMKKLTYLLLYLASIAALVYPQQYKIQSYNLLNYPGNDTTTRNPYFRTVIASVNPDILVVQEMTSQAGVNGFLNNVMNSVLSGYAAGIFLDGPDTDNAIFFKTAYFTFLANNPIHTSLRDISEFVLRENTTGDTLRIYSVHLKASSGTTNEQQRLAEVTILRNVTDALPDNSNYIIVGDYNFYGSNEPAYQKLLDKSTKGYFLDPITMTGIWNNAIYAPYHTQSPRVRQFGGGATGGLDDRFDLLLVSQAVWDEGGMYLVPGTYTAYGNDGLHYNDSINRPPNNAVGQTIANALHYASDHLPVYAEFSFTGTVNVADDKNKIIPESVTLEQNYPNPFNPATIIVYSLPQTAFVTLKVYNVLGREVATLVDENKSAGSYEVKFDASELPSGFYFYQLRAGEYIQTKKMVLLK